MTEKRRLQPDESSLILPSDLLQRINEAAGLSGMSPAELIEAALHKVHQPSRPRHAVYLSTPIDALMKGCYQQNISIRELKRHGNFGLGTFNDLDGEMMMLDGLVYQLKDDGFAHEVSDTAETPFSCVTFFHPTTTEFIERRLDYVAFKNLLDQLMPSENIFSAVRIEGEFSTIRVWSVPRQPAWRPITEVKPRAFAFENVRGTVAGFFTPRFIKSLLHPGFHLHFLSEDRLHGGHLDQCTLEHMTISVQTIPRLELNLPITVDYLTARLM